METLFCYFTPGDAAVTDWHGNRLGTVISKRVYRHNFGGRFIAVRVRLADGSEWHGRASHDNGTCVNLHRCKQPAAVTAPAPLRRAA